MVAMARLPRVAVSGVLMRSPPRGRHYATSITVSTRGQVTVKRFQECGEA
jgi:hypothetical protein